MIVIGEIKKTEKKHKNQERNYLIREKRDNKSRKKNEIMKELTEKVLDLIRYEKKW